MHLCNGQQWQLSQQEPFSGLDQADDAWTHPAIITTSTQPDVMCLLRWGKRNTQPHLCSVLAKKTELDLIKPLDVTTSLQEIPGTEKQVEGHHEAAVGKSGLWGNYRANEPASSLNIWQEKKREEELPVQKESKRHFNQIQSVDYIWNPIRTSHLKKKVE